MEIIYTPLTMGDGEAFFRLAGDERVAATMRFDCPGTREDSDRILADYISDGNRSFALRFREKEELFGIFAFKSEIGSDTADLSQMLLPEHWGQGLGNRVIADMVALARKEKWYKRLNGYILETNTASRRMAERNGFGEKERRRYSGMTEDLVIYQLEL